MMVQIKLLLSNQRHSRSLCKNRNMAHKSYSRVARVNHLIQEVLAEEIELIDDDDLELITVTGCDVSPDLRHAKVFISAMGNDEKREKALVALEEHRGRLKRAMSKSTRMKFLPDLHFMGDPSIDTGFAIEVAIKNIHNNKGSFAVRSDSAFEDE